MCLIVHRPAGCSIPAHWLENAARRNPDGWGVMWASKGTLKVARGFGVKKLHTAVAAAGKYGCAVHLRYATHGQKTVENCHPFPILDGRFAVMHNGMIEIARPDLTKSDTWAFAHHVVEPMLRHAKDGFFEDPDFAGILGAMVGDENKLLVMRADGRTVLVNPQSGSERDGLWLSNTYSIADPLPEPSRKTVTLWDGDTGVSDEAWTRWIKEPAGYPTMRDVWRSNELEELPALDQSRCNADDDERDIPDLVMPADPWECIDMDYEDLEDCVRADPAHMAEVLWDAVAYLKKAYS